MSSVLKCVKLVIGPEVSRITMLDKNTKSQNYKEAIKGNFQLIFPLNFIVVLEIWADGLYISS